MERTKRDEILDVAELGMRRAGYEGVSFRDIASAVGVKSASVHHHFPKKTDLGRAAVERYGDRFLAALGSPDDPAEQPCKRIARLAAAYRGALAEGKAGCLCAVLGAVSGALPEEVAEAVRGFYARILGWTGAALEDSPCSLTPEAVVGALQGAMILAIALRRPGILDAAAEAMVAEARG